MLVSSIFVFFIILIFCFLQGYVKVDTTESFLGWFRHLGTGFCVSRPWPKLTLLVLTSATCCLLNDRKNKTKLHFIQIAIQQTENLISFSQLIEFKPQSNLHVVYWHGVPKAVIFSLSLKNNFHFKTWPLCKVKGQMQPSGLLFSLSPLHLELCFRLWGRFCILLKISTKCKKKKHFAKKFLSWMQI